MKMFVTSTRRATIRYLNSRRQHLHGERRLGFSRQASNPTGLSKSTWLWLSGCRYSSSSSTIQNATYESSHRLRDSKKVDLEIISRETIKPRSPTPRHLRTFNLSIIDQLMFDVYTPFIYFLPNTNKASVTDVVNKRSKRLKEALSEILTRFYPLAGKIKDNLHIECNDEGVNYMDARVNQTMEEFLSRTDDRYLRELLPESPHTTESSTGNYVIGIQVNIFNCGGIGLSTSLSHKIFDGQTSSLFMKAWAAAVRGSPDTISPSFEASKIFPNNPFSEYSVPSKLMATKAFSTKRFVFDSNALGLLKSQPVSSSSSSRPPTRMEATAAVIWKAAAKAASTLRPFSPHSPHAMLSVVNFRKIATPCLPETCFGNLIQAAAAICLPKSQPDVPTLMGELRMSIANMNSDYIESMKGEKGHETFNEILKNLNHLADTTAEGDCILASSLLNTGIYDLDFGWGKPIWYYFANAGLCRFVALNDMLKGGGVEAIVTLSPDEMDIFERDPELLSYANLDPSPLRHINQGRIYVCSR